MPQSHYIENLLDLKDTNIEVLADKPIQIVTIRKKQCKVIFAKLSPKIVACHTCGALADRVIKHGTKTSLVKINAVVGYDTYLQIKKQRYFCKECEGTFTAMTTLVDKGCCISKPLKAAILLEAQEVCSEKSLAKRFGVSHQTVHRMIHQKAFQLKTSYDYLPSFLGIDEFKSTRSASGAMSFILGDAYNKELIDIVEDRRLPSLIRYFHRYDLAVRKRVRGVVMDMYEPYIQFVKQCFPRAEIIIDRFHVIQHLNRAMNKIRIQSMKHFPVDGLEYKLLKKHWQLLLKPRLKLRDSYYHYRLLDRLVSERELVETILSTDEELKMNWLAYQNLLVSYQNRDETRFFRWLERYDGTLHDHLNTVMATFQKLAPYIRNSFRTKLTVPSSTFGQESSSVLTSPKNWPTL